MGPLVWSITLVQRDFKGSEVMYSVYKGEKKKGTQIKGPYVGSLYVYLILSLYSDVAPRLQRPPLVP